MENNQPPAQQPLQSPEPLQPVIQPVQSPVPPSDNNRKKIVIITLVVLVAVLLIVVSFFIFKKSAGISKVPSNISPTITIQTPTLVPTKIIDSTSEMTLLKGKSVEIPDSDIQIVYTGASIPNKNCFDCTSTTDILLTQKNVQKRLSFSCGGIAGQCTDILSGLGFEITLEKATDTTAQVKVKKQ